MPGVNIGQTTFSVAPWSSQKITVSLIPSSSGKIAGQIQIQTDRSPAPAIITVLAQAVQPQLVLQLSFEEESGTTAQDISPFGNHAQFHGIPLRHSNGPAGDYLEFGQGNWLQIPDNDSLDLTSAMTISMWAKIRNDTGEPQSGLEKEPSWQNGEYNLCPVYSGGVLLQAQDWPDEVDDEAITSQSIIDNQWHYITGTWDGNFIRVYIDGILQQELPCQGQILAGDGDIYIGSRGGSQRWVDGYLDEIRVYNVALDQNQIIAAMASGHDNWQAGLTITS